MEYQLAALVAVYNMATLKSFAVRSELSTTTKPLVYPTLPTNAYV